MLALTSVMACGIAACGGGDNGEVDSSGNTIVKIMFHVDEKSTEGQAYKKRIDAFNTAYKDKKIKASATYKARRAPCPTLYRLTRPTALPMRNPNICTIFPRLFRRTFRTTFCR